VREFAARSVTPATGPGERLTVKVVVRNGEVERARREVETRGGELSAGDAPRPDGPGLPVLLARVPLDALPGLDGSDSILRIEAARPLHLLLDQARGPATGLDAALVRHALTGDGVVIGVVDSGVDWRHADFRDAGGGTRIERLLHAHLPPGTEESRYDVYSRQDIDKALAGNGNVPDGDPHGHGTHCASIAAGTGTGSAGLLSGVAPGAVLVATRAEPLLDTHIIQGIRETFDAAGDRPTVVNLSLGGHVGPHDGTSAIENEIARLSGPGRIVVVAAGNEGSDQIHVSGRLVPGVDLVIPFRIDSAEVQFADVWIPRGDDVDVFVETPDGTLTIPDGEVHQGPFGLFQADFVEDPVNRDQNFFLAVARGHANDLWALRIRPVQVVHGEVHAWAGPEPFLFPGAASPEYSVGMPGTEERAIVVGSLVSRNRFDTVQGEVVSNLSVGQLSPFSSHGPARYGAQKPDITAPGQFVTAALAEGSVLATDPRYVPRRSPIVPGPYVTIQGTSMAAPFVTGVVALLLEREPTLNPEEVQQRLRITARRDAGTGRVWNAGFGYGRLDVEALLDY
jgi:subtilisin family serine protease